MYESNWTKYALNAKHLPQHKDPPSNIFVNSSSICRAIRRPGVRVIINASKLPTLSEERMRLRVEHEVVKIDHIWIRERQVQILEHLGKPEPACDIVS